MQEKLQKMTIFLRTFKRNFKQSKINQKETSSHHPTADYNYRQTVTADHHPAAGYYYNQIVTVDIPFLLEPKHGKFQTINKHKSSHRATISINIYDMISDTCIDIPIWSYFFHDARIGCLSSMRSMKKYSKCTNSWMDISLPKVLKGCLPTYPTLRS